MPQTRGRSGPTCPVMRSRTSDLSGRASDIRNRPDAWPLLVVFLAIPSVVELALIAADAGWIGVPRLRATIYQYGAFWAGLLDNWRPNYAAQPWLMFLTYSFLHFGFWHLAGNMLALVMLMHLTAQRLTGWAFVLVYIASAVGGGLGFALLGPVVTPMVGASGALFGLVGAWRWQEWQPLTAGRTRAILRDLAILAGLNLLMWVLEKGALAWEAHLGGFVTGVACMAAIDRVRAPRRT